MKAIRLVVLSACLIGCGAKRDAAPASTPDAAALPTVKLQVIAAEQGDVDRIVGDDTHIYWINRRGMGLVLMRAERSSGRAAVVTESPGLPCDLALHGDFVLLTLADRVLRVPKAGGAVEVLARELSRPCAIATHGDLIYVSTRSEVLRIAPGRPPELVERIRTRVALAADADGVYYYDGWLTRVPHDAPLPIEQKFRYRWYGLAMSDVWLTEEYVFGMVIDVELRGWKLCRLPRDGRTSDCDLEAIGDGFPIGHGINARHAFWSLRGDRRGGVDLVKGKGLDMNSGYDEVVVSSPGLTGFFTDGAYVVWVDDGKVITKATSTGSVLN